uniref:Uncharacterized protein n=1 Tax=Arundo donax TaxID=35708 RepID=A0A0A9GZ63_ARUDO
MPTMSGSIHTSGVRRARARRQHKGM